MEEKIIPGKESLSRGKKSIRRRRSPSIFKRCQWLHSLVYPKKRFSRPEGELRLFDEDHRFRVGDAAGRRGLGPLGRIGRPWCPPWGALHEGHLTLIRRARAANRRVVVSIYVNPTPVWAEGRPCALPAPRVGRDLALCRAEGVDLVFAPGKSLSARSFDPLWKKGGFPGAATARRGRGISGGVATVVLKLFNLVRPVRAYFGQKDAQQVDVIRRMVRDLDVPVRIVTVPTVRDPDRLALSSRNRYLSPEERKIAVQFALKLQGGGEEGKGGVWPGCVAS